MRIKKGDNYTEEFVMYWDDGTIIDLTDALSVKFMMIRDDPDAVMISGPCFISDPINGKLQYEFTSEQTAVPGMYKYEFQITWTYGETFTVPSGAQLWILIINDIGD